LAERDLAVQSLGAAIQNLLLSADANGLGACWFSSPLFCKETVRMVLGVPETVEPQAAILMGYPDEKPAVPKRKSLKETCFRNCWGSPF
jgi:coenzyme F420-0:L-glutamate ligase/coenzyme F420-1:gamma-L-glutamate ligase